MVWVPVIHRLISAEKVTHNVKCQCCNAKDFTGFRYKSLKVLMKGLTESYYFNLALPSRLVPGLLFVRKSKRQKTRPLSLSRILQCNGNEREHQGLRKFTLSDEFINFIIDENC
jgi:hypothetical protein